MYRLFSPQWVRYYQAPFTSIDIPQLSTIARVVQRIETNEAKKLNARISGRANTSQGIRVRLCFWCKDACLIGIHKERRLKREIAMQSKFLAQIQPRMMRGFAGAMQYFASER